jgi:hypothetical protein
MMEDLGKSGDTAGGAELMTEIESEAEAVKAALQALAPGKAG